MFTAVFGCSFTTGDPDRERGGAVSPPRVGDRGGGERGGGDRDRGGGEDLRGGDRGGGDGDVTVLSMEVSFLFSAETYLVSEGFAPVDFDVGSNPCYSGHCHGHLAVVV
eukprot:CAMPEP_0169314198 /NCGR_PEP_ID=MMETSP1017-20121227/4978_1 /TAXON_ID=342587 /ORGANISM="Karlodinium micrum, Strain CCMP2283" /LENGTH=108 /DNA_ID=CAMNT_0009408097 /DNA_START=356 /DNA_END=679 /DNA_ORIENTATION=+